jgi:hypothetical protein
MKGMGRATALILSILAVIVLGLPSVAPVAYSQTVDTTCTDSDGGLNYEIAGFVSGTGPAGWPYTKYDICETGGYTGYVKEFYCNGDVPIPTRYLCENGCQDGACLPGCTDGDGDTYAVEGGACGPVDCDDTNPAVNPGADEVCDNGVDDDCNGLIDGDDLACACTDNDGDTYAVEGDVCGPVDCDDTDPAVNPGADEVCDNGVDDDCNGLVDGADPACPLCYDSDGGLNFFTAGSVVVEGGGSYLDECTANPGELLEWACDPSDTAFSQTFACPGDCSDGACASPNIIVVGWDGTQRDHFWQCLNQQLPECAGGLPNIAQLTIYDNTTTNGGTATKPGWAQHLTGYNAEVTGVFSNGDYQPIPVGYTTFEKIENHLGADNVVTMFVSGKDVHTGGACIGDPTYWNGVPVIENQGQPWCYTKDFLDYYENDLRLNEVVGGRALELLEQHQSDLFFAFFLFRDPDVTGHVAGEDSDDYSRVMIEVDGWLGQIMAKLQDLGIADRTLVYVTTDHGFDEGLYRHGNAPYGFLATNDPLVVREGDRRDLAATILETYGIDRGPIGGAPALDGFSLHSMPPLACVPEGEAYIDYEGAPACCDGLQLISLDQRSGPMCVPATGGTGDNSGYCTACGDGVCTSPENRCNCPADCQ